MSNNEIQQLTLGLPYEQITELAVRNDIRARKEITRGARESVWIPFELLEVREGFNFEEREKLEIIELAELIIAAATNPADPYDGLLNPIYVDVLKDGRILIERGHRRYFAIKYIREVLGLPFEKVEAFINKKETTEENRVLNLYVDNSQRALTLMQEADVAYRLKFYFGTEKSNADVAIRMRISRQKVDYLIQFAQLPDEHKKVIRDESMGFKKAKDYLDALKPAKEKSEKAEINANKNSASAASPQGPDVNAQELKDSAAIEHRLEEDVEPAIQTCRNCQCTSDDCQYWAEDDLCGNCWAEMLLIFADKIELEKIAEDKLPELYGQRIADTVEYFINGKISEIKKDTILNADNVKILRDNEVLFIYVYKPGKYIMPSVITEPIAGKDKGKYDEGRLEIKQINNVIGLTDKLEIELEKLDPATAKGMLEVVSWIRKDALEVREYVHANKKENKKNF